MNYFMEISFNYLVAFHKTIGMALVLSAVIKIILLKFYIKLNFVESCPGPGSFNEFCNSPSSACSPLCQSNLTCDAGKCK